MNLYVWKLWETAHMPEYGTEWAACFDLKASLRFGDEVTVYRSDNTKTKRNVNQTGIHPANVSIYAGERMLVPTGLIFDLDQGYSLRIHPRSGLSLKQGITIANCEGVVDPDYVHQTFVMMHNTSTQPFHIEDGMRIAQAEIVPMLRVNLTQSDREPEQKTSRSGGFGSTGLV